MIFIIFIIISIFIFVISGFSLNKIVLDSVQEEIDFLRSIVFQLILISPEAPKELKDEIIKTKEKLKIFIEMFEKYKSKIKE